jgi:putative salt-induced outer membrane protein
MKALPAALALVLAAPLAQAQDAASAPSGWTGTGELGYVSSSGNSRSDSLNAKVNFKFEDEQWKHEMFAAGLRQRAERVVLVDPDNPDSGERVMERSANRYELGGTTARKLDDRNALYASLRYENDDFAAFDYQATLSVGWGHQAIRSEDTNLYFEVGPGYKRVKDRETNATDGYFIGRGKMDFSHKLTENTSLVDTFLVEAGSDNTYLQNDFGLQVAMNSRLAIKAGLQHRHNTDVPDGVKKTDRLTTVNLVYNF